MNEDQSDLKSLLEQNLRVAEDNNRLLRLMRRDAYIGMAAKAILYLLLFGVPLFFLSQYLAPLMSAFSAAGTSSSTGVLVAPGPDEIRMLKEAYGF